MTLSLSLVPEFNHEAVTTRTFLERIPEDRLDWKPHPRSGSIAWLASHLADIPSWTVQTLSGEQMDVAPGGQPLVPMPLAPSRSEILTRFDRNVHLAREALASASDADMTRTWSMLQDLSLIHI